jgi:hypothetical protein
VRGAGTRPLLRLPTRDGIRDSLAGKGVEGARAAAERTEAPLTVTKRGALVFGRRR